ncbi:MAG: ORF6N domain-containing protein [Bacilli bacterium]|nr:ORF6N domain-containing protein [Bacilli bacterium]
MTNNLSINVKSKIYVIRGKQVMLDSDLAILYKCSNGTKVINQAVSRNRDRFPPDFYFQLSKEEYKNLKSQIVTSSCDKEHGGVRKMPYVFTEQGVAMLASVLRTKIAADVSIGIMRAFVEMRKYISNNLFDVSKALTNLDDRVKVLEDAFVKNDGTGIYYEGSIYDAYSAIIDIFKKAKKSLIIIDNYVDKDTLDIISKFSVKVTIITNKETCYINKIDIDKYNDEYKNLRLIYNKSFHDRFFIIDKKEVYHSGASINRLGHKTFAINEIIDDSINKIFIDNINNIINNKSKELIP